MTLGKARPAVLVLHDSLAVQDKPFDWKPPSVSCNGREALGDVVAVAGVDRNAIVLDVRLSPIAIELDLVNPFRALWWVLNQRGLHWFDEVRHARMGARPESSAP